MDQISSDMGVTLVQPFNGFIEHPERSTFYFGNVGHLSVTGHQEIAAHLFSRRFPFSGLK